MKTLYLTIIVIGITLVTISFQTSFALGYGSIARPATTSTPLNLFKIGVSVKDIMCEKGFEKVIRAEDGSPACVTPDTAQKLMERGWAKKGQTAWSVRLRSSIGTANLTLAKLDLYHLDIWHKDQYLL